jgi:hypothetical protein
MGKTKAALEDWLDDCGYELGYDMEFYPNLSQFNKIKTKRIYRREYGKWQSKASNR